MNGTIISEEKLLELKDLARKIENIEIQLICFGNDDMLILAHLIKWNTNVLIMSSNRSMALDTFRQVTSLLEKTPGSI